MTRYSISDLAHEFEVTTRTLRFYEEKGLLNPQRDGQRRIYNTADRVRLRLILRGKRLGLSLEESCDIIGMYDPEHGNLEQLNLLLSKIRQKRELLNQQQLDIEDMLNELERSETRCLQAIQNTETATH